MLSTIPKIGYGTWNREGAAAFEGTLAALNCGYRHIDTAEGYGNEDQVGRAIAASGIARQDIWVTTKVAPESFAPGQVRGHVDASLEKLGVGPVDLLLLHYPSIGDEFAMEDYIAQFAEIVQAGLCRHLGVSNFTIRHIERARELLGDIPIYTNQVELHPFLANTPIVARCRNLGIPLTAYSPLARGTVMEDPVLQEIAASLKATPAQVALAWLLAQGHVVIPSAGHPDRIAENLAAGDLTLDADQMTRITALDRGLRLIDGPWCPRWDS